MKGTTVLCKRIHPKGSLNKGAYKGDAGLDVVSVKDQLIPAFSRVQIPCGIQIALPEGLAALMIGRSSMAMKGLMVIPTLIEQYRGDIFVFAFNCSTETIEIREGDRVAQLVPIAAAATLLDVEYAEELPPSDRGHNGFGSSGR